MRFVPYSQDRWFRLKSLSKPDREWLDFCFGVGEWSIWREESFNKHIRKLDKYTKVFSNLNGRKLKQILKYEPLQYGKTELAELI